MKEELFVETDGGYARVDLNDPSGISLNFKSNMFGDLSKITCSHSYTFSLPLTMNNRRIFDFAEDVRHHSSMTRKRLTAMYCQNGINIFRNANLYLESVSGAYKAVMTWDVVSGMQTLIDNGISLNELPNDGEECLSSNIPVPYKTENEAFSNIAHVLHPLYNCGVPWFRWSPEWSPVSSTEGNYHRSMPQYYTYFSSYPMPVVPVQRVIELINSHFGTKFNLGNPLGIGEASNYDTKSEVVEKGVLPLVGLDLTYDNRHMRRAVLAGMNFTNLNGDKGVKIEDVEGDVTFYDAVTFNQISIQKNDFLKAAGFRFCRPDRSNATLFNNIGVMPQYNNISLEIDGVIQGKFYGANASDGYDGSNPPTLTIYQMQGGSYYLSSSRRMVFKWEWVELGSVTGELVGTGSTDGKNIFEFDFCMENGASRISFDSSLRNSGTHLAYSPIILAFSHRIGVIKMVQKDIEIFIKNGESCINPHPIDIVGNLPDIGCMEFVKSLFYMMGAFPVVNSEGEIIPRFYTEIKENLESGKVVDWSSRCSGQFDDGKGEIQFSQKDNSQRNYYLMKSDSLDKKADPDGDLSDEYAPGIGCIEVDNPTLSMSKTVIQVPFFAPFIRSKENPGIETGSTIKCWTLEGKELDYRRSTLEGWCKPNPALGIIKDREYGYIDSDGAFHKAGDIMTMEVWNGFTEMSSNPSFAYLQEIMRKPFVVTETMRLNEFDLLDLDYAVPVYLNKYNSYFAVVSIQRDSKGDCKCELIRLP